MSNPLEQTSAATSGKVWKASVGPMLASGFGVAMIGAVTALMLVMGVVMAPSDGWGLAAFFVAMASICGLLTLHVGRDMLGKRPWRIAVAEGELRLDLPANRSLIRQTPACRAAVPLADVAAIETRVESYPGPLGSTLQRAFRLKRTDGSAIFLFEERAGHPICNRPAGAGRGRDRPQLRRAADRPWDLQRTGRLSGRPFRAPARLVRRAHGAARDGQGLVRCAHHRDPGGDRGGDRGAAVADPVALQPASNACRIGQGPASPVAQA